METQTGKIEDLGKIDGPNIPKEVTMGTKDQVESITNLKTKVLEELNNPGLPNLKFLFSSEVLAVLPDILNELLEEEKKKFNDFITKPIEELSFEEDFDDFDKLSYLYSLINHLDGVEKSDTTEKIIEDFQPIYVAYSNEVSFSKPFYERVVYLLNNTQVDSEQKRILEKIIKRYELEGINLDEETQEKIKELNIKLAKLSTDFTNNIVKSKKEFSYLITDFEAIKDLPEATLNAAKEKAKKEGKDGYLFDADPTAYVDIMKYCHDRNIRKDFAEAKNSFATSGEFDNRAIVLEIIKLKDEKAKLLGFKNFAEFSLAKKMAKKPETVFELIEGITAKAKEKALKDVEELKIYYGLEVMEHYDSFYYPTKYKKERYEFDDKELKKYFEYDNVLKYLFDFVGNFYGVELKKLETETYNEDVSVFEVYRNGQLISYYILDPFYRDSKNQGAWADNPRGRYEGKEGKKVPVIVNVCNFQKGEKAKTLLTKRDVETLYHEFGHALHEILSESKYSSLSGFNVEWDFVELPSQINENWVSDRESLEKLAKHFETGESIPKYMLDILDSLKTYMSGVDVLSQNCYTLLDMNIYSSTPPESVEELDKKTLELCNANTIFPKGPEFKMYASFGHIFGGGYSAGYYSYMRAEILEADVFERIKEMGMFDRATGEKFISTILGQGTRKEGGELFKDFMGRELSSVAFMRRKGLM